MNMKLKKIIILIIIFCGIVFCVNKISSNDILLTINDEKIILNKENLNNIDLITLNNEKSIEIKKIKGIGKIM